MAAKKDEKITESADLHEPEEMGLLNVLSDLGGIEDVKVSVYRTGREYHGKQIFIASMAPEEFSLEYLRDKCGGGDFRIHIRKDGGLIANRAVSVEKQKEKTDVETLAEMMKQNNIQNNQNQNSDGLERMVETMSTGFSQLGQMLIQMQSNQAPAPAPVDPTAQMTSMLAMMASMKDIMSNKEPVINPMDGILKGIELAKEIVPKEGEANTFDVLLESIKTFGKPIAEMAGQLTNKTLPNNTINHLPAGMPQKQPQAPQPPNEGAMFKILVKHQVSMLLKQAARGADPGLYADLILDQLSEDQIQKFLGDPNWFANITAIVPEITNYQDWFTQLHDFVMASLTDEVDPAMPIESSTKIEQPPIMTSPAGMAYDETSSDYDENSSG